MDFVSELIQYLSEYGERNGYETTVGYKRSCSIVKADFRNEELSFPVFFDASKPPEIFDDEYKEMVDEVCAYTMKQEKMRRAWIKQDVV